MMDFLLYASLTADILKVQLNVQEEMLWLWGDFLDIISDQFTKPTK